MTDHNPKVGFSTTLFVKSMTGLEEELKEELKAALRQEAQSDPE
jgi:hypothetical protein